MPKKKIIYGLIEEKPQPQHWRFGGVTGIVPEVLQPTGHGWEAYLPISETQSSVELNIPICVTMSALNVLEMLHKRKYGTEINISDRFTAKMSGTNSQGNYVSNVAESIRKNNGTVDEAIWPWDKATINTWEKYFSEIPQNIQDLGIAWLSEFQINHEWVSINPNNLKEALKYSPLQVTGTAWYVRPNGQYYSPAGKIANHAFTLYDWIENEKWLVFDSYDNTKKDLEWGFNFASAFRYSLLKIDNMFKTIKVIGKPEVYVNFPNSQNLYQIGGFESYQTLLAEGAIKAFVEVPNLTGYVLKNVIGLIK